MHLLHALEIDDHNQIDPTRPILVKGLEFGVEAACEAVRILKGGDYEKHIKLEQRQVTKAQYWLIQSISAAVGEIILLPDKLNSLPTAIEIGIIRALAASDPQYHDMILSGSIHIALGNSPSVEIFKNISLKSKEPLAGKSPLWDQYTVADIPHSIDKNLTPTIFKCIENSFNTSPLKFRFLELYRIMEARFLADIKTKLLSRFDKEPKDSLDEAIEKLRSEINQLISLAEDHKEQFELIFDDLREIKNTNQFAAALFRKLNKKKPEGSGGNAKWQSGAALIYMIRCAIVHAGEKDIIFESFPDGEILIEKIIQPTEIAALSLIGIKLLESTIKSTEKPAIIEPSASPADRDAPDTRPAPSS